MLDLLNSGELDDDDKCSVGKDAMDLEVHGTSTSVNEQTLPIRLEGEQTDGVGREGQRHQGSDKEISQLLGHPSSKPFISL